MDLSEIISTSDHNENEGNDEETVDNPDSLVFIKNKFSMVGIPIVSITALDKAYFPDRFGAESIVKYQLNQLSDTLFYCKWRFSDSTKVMNAFFNWIDCFGEKCNSFYVGESRNFQLEPMQILVSDTTLIYIQSKKELDFDKILLYHDTLGYERDWNYLMEQKRKGKMHWFTFLDEKKIKYTNENSK